MKKLLIAALLPLAPALASCAAGAVPVVAEAVAGARNAFKLSKAACRALPPSEIAGDGKVARACRLLLGAGPAAEASAPPEAAAFRRALCYGPVHDIPDDDPGLALYVGREATIDDRKVRLAIERANSCDFDERPIETLSPDEYEAMTGGEFVCDDHPERCRPTPDRPAARPPRP